jgi:hypothetical protein
VADRSEGIRVTGAKELRRAIKKAEDQGLKDALKRAYRESATLVSDASKIRVPVKSGDLRNSIRPLGGIGSAVVAAGRGRTNDYAGVVHYGWPAHNIEPQEFIHEALKTKWDAVVDSFESAIDHMTREI